MSPTTSNIADTFTTLALGQAVKLGELFNARKDQLLGVQLYSDTQISGATTSTDIKHTNLELSMANSCEDKSALINISAELSLEVLSGLVKVKGSAAYLNDAKSNTREKSWAMVLQQRLTEKRLLFAQDNLGNNALDFAKKNYIATGVATHFVSAIEYGGDLIVSMVARTERLTEEEKVEGALEAELQKLKGVVDLNAKASVEIKSKYDNLNDMFDINIYGDIALTSVPVNPEDVLDILPEACSLIGNGVPLSITLQPIPADIINEAILINRIENSLLEDLLGAFGSLDDVRSRFEVLQSSATVYKEFIPNLATSINKASSKFQRDRQALIRDLADCVRGLRSTAVDTVKLIKGANDLYETHTEEVESYTTTTYPSDLDGLEAAFSDFMRLVANVENIGLTLTTLGDVILDVMKYPSIVLVLMSALYTNCDANFILFSSQARLSHIAYSGQNPVIPVYYVYVENGATLERRLPNHGLFEKLAKPSIYLGTHSDGVIDWTSVALSQVQALVPATLYHLALDLVAAQIENPWTSVYALSVMSKLNTSQSFSVVASLQSRMVSDRQEAPFLKLLNEIDQPKIKFQAPWRGVVSRAYPAEVDIQIQGPDDRWLSLSQDNVQLVEQGRDFTVAFVQNVETNKWCFFLNGKKINDRPIIPNSLPKQLTLAICKFDQEENFEGYLYGVSVYQTALTEVELKTAATNSGSTLMANKKGRNAVKHAFQLTNHPDDHPKRLSS